ncbi:MAG TPA: hypothetical protein VGO52_14635 [Hyphomonadaceae bacterium]|jgi:hypothetical protein|nr:hypothetical protein [Hyphomonadaceae bacterium]
MKTTTLMLCLVAGLTTSGCIIHHTETIPARHELEDEHTRPEGVAFAPPNVEPSSVARTAG